MAGALILLEGDPTTLTPVANHTIICVNQSGQIALIQPDGEIDVLTSSAPGYQALANASGTTTITTTAAIERAQLTLSGTARAVPVVLSDTGGVGGGQLDVLLIFPAVAGLAVTIRDSSGTGTILATYNSDGVTLSAKYSFVFTGGAWSLWDAQIPAF